MAIKVYVVGWGPQLQPQEEGHFEVASAATTRKDLERQDKIEIRNRIHFCNTLACLPVINIVAGIFKVVMGAQQCYRGNATLGAALILTGTCDALLWPLMPLVHIIASQCIAHARQQHQGETP